MSARAFSTPESLFCSSIVFQKNIFTALTEKKESEKKYQMLGDSIKYILCQTMR